jgi:outer membrane immunogenic protein
MKRVVLACVGMAALVSAAPALAADLPLKAAPMAVYNWTGWYVGGNLGYGGGNETASETTTSGAAFPLIGPGFPLYNSPNAFRLSPQGVVGGVQAGYNWQSATNFLVGIEADIQGSDIHAGVACVVGCGAPIVTTLVNPILGAFPVRFAADSFSQRLQWFGTVRGRVGYVSGLTLIYATGGLAYGDVERTGNVRGVTLNPGGTVRNTFIGSYDNSTTKVGWTVGFGAEGKWIPNSNWSVKGEYLYVDLGSNSDTFNTTFQTPGNPAAGVAATRTDTSYNREHIFRLGLNYAIH